MGCGICNSFVDYRNRMNENARIQKDWANQQVAEKEAIANHEASEEAQYAN